MVDITPDQAKENFDVTVLGTLRLVRAVTPHMASRKSGLVVTIGSVAGELCVIYLHLTRNYRTNTARDRPTPFNGMYCASKAALHSLTETLSMELTPFNIKTLLVIPASVKSNIATNHSRVFQLPPQSLYKHYLDRIVARMYMSQ